VITSFDSSFVAQATTQFQLQRVYRCCTSDGVPRRSFLAALIVGTILAMRLQSFNLLKAFSMRQRSL
jgi:hypothetical protein